MSKFKYTNKKGQVNVLLKLEAKEQIDVGVAGYLAGNRLRGFLTPAPDKSGGIIYSGAVGIPLSQFLVHPINKDQFYIIIAHLLEAYKTIMCVNLNPAMISLDPDNIIITESTGQIHLVYQPIIYSQTPNQGFMRCFGQICSMLKYASPQDPVSIGMFSSFIKGLPVFSVSEIEKFILESSPGTYNFVQRMPFNDPMAAPSSAVQKAPAEPEVPQYSEFAPRKDVSDAKDYSSEETILPSPPVAEPEPEIVPEPVQPAKLVRRSTGESVVIDKDTFVIGKERARVNFCVTENKTVSRVHATILRKTDGYYITDNDSTNKTYINGTQIPALTEIKLVSGDVLKLSNEEFDFTC